MDSAAARSMEVHSRLLELRWRARPRLPSLRYPAQHDSPHAVCHGVGFYLVRAARKILADSALSPSSFHHSGLATSPHSPPRSMWKAVAMAQAHSSEPTG
eukprot:scaffold36968_cov62-Phaeocystis_antarctica.AAC.1